MKFFCRQQSVKNMLKEEEAGEWIQNITMSDIVISSTGGGLFLLFAVCMIIVVSYLKRKIRTIIKFLKINYNFDAFNITAEMSTSFVNSASPTALAINNNKILRQQSLQLPSPPNQSPLQNTVQQNQIERQQWSEIMKYRNSTEYKPSAVKHSKQSRVTSQTELKQSFPLQSTSSSNTIAYTPLQPSEYVNVSTSTPNPDYVNA